MKFIIRRVSDYDGDKCPFLGAIKESVAWIDRQPVDDPSKIRFPHVCADGTGASWYSEGVNHRVENGWICRDFPNRMTAWTIEVPDLDALMEMIKDAGYGFIVHVSDHYQHHEIQIFDDDL